MSALAETFAKHRSRILAEVLSSLQESPIEPARDGGRGLEALLEELLDATLLRLREPTDPRLMALLRVKLRSKVASRAALLGYLVRLGTHLRATLFRETQSRRAAATASAAIDAVVAGAIAQLDDVPSASAAAVLELPSAFASSSRPIDPTIVRNIREALAGPSGDDMIATVVALALRPRATAHGATMVGTKQKVHDVAGAVIKRSGATPMAAGPSFLAGYIPARVDDTDAEEGLQLAIDLARLPETTGCGIGVARGRLCASAEAQAEAFGEAFLSAAALAAYAEAGRLLCSPAVATLTRNAYVLRGFETSVSAYALNPEQPQWSERWEQAALVGEPMMVGREDTLTRLGALLVDKSERVKVLNLRGRAGAGKDRLLLGAVERAGIPSGRLLRGEPHPLAPVPYWPLVAILRQALGLDEEEQAVGNLREAVSRLEAQSPRRESLSPHLPALEALLAPAEATDAFADSEPASVRSELTLALKAVLEAVAAKAPSWPLVLVIRDAQRLDTPSAGTLARVLAEYQGEAPFVLVLLSRRAVKLPPQLLALPVREIALGRLSQAAVQELARSMLDQEDLPQGLGELLAQRSDGSPMMAAALIRFLVESGCLQRRSGTWTTTEAVAAADLPRRLPELLRRRIEQLPPALVGLLKAAATLGDAITWPALELVAVSLGMVRDELTRDLALLVELGFLRGGRGEPVRFGHALVREVAYRLQQPEERRLAHRFAADAFAECYPGATRPMAAVLFTHLAAAGDIQGAREAAVLAVQRAVLLQDNKSALAFVEEGLALCDDDSPESLTARFDLLLARERIHDSRGRRAEQKSDIKMLVMLAEKLADEQRLGGALHRAARLNLLTGDLTKARALAQKAVERLRHGDRLDLSNALRTLALVRWHERDAAGAGAALNEALRIYAQINHRRGMGFVLHSLGLFALDTGALDQAHHHLERALALKQETNDKRGEATVLDALGQVAACRGDRLAAAEFLERALALKTEAGDLAGSAQTQLSLGECLLSAEAARAEALARAALKSQAPRKKSRTDVEGRLLLAQALLRQGKREAAGRCAALAERRAEGLAARLLVLRAQIVQAEVDLAYKSPERAGRAAKAARAAAEAALKAGAVRWRVEALSLLGCALARLEDEGAAAVAAEALTLVNERPPVGLDLDVIRQRCEAVLGSASPPSNKHADQALSS